MNGFVHYFLSFFDANLVLDYFATVPMLIGAVFKQYGLYSIIILILFFYNQLGIFLLWLVSMVWPKFIFPPLSPSMLIAKPLVSVIIPGFNEGTSIAGTLRSVMGCGYDNLEVIFIDDGSSDETVIEARRVAASMQRSSDSRALKLTVFSSPRQHGKSSAINIGIKFAKGEFIAIVDADSELQRGSIPHWLEPFTDPKVGAVGANIRVLNPTESLVTRIQENEYASRMTLLRLLSARLHLLSLIPGPAGMFRAHALRSIGGYDPGLGEDGDVTLRLQKAGWKLGFSLDAVVWTGVPATWRQLTRQRQRWSRNTVMIRLSKHSDMLSPLMPFGFMNMLRSYITFKRIVQSWFVVLIGIIVLAGDPFSRPYYISNLYWIALFFSTVKIAISRDLTQWPPPRAYLIGPLMPFYHGYLIVVTMISVFREMLRINSRHPYVPSYMWDEIPRW